MTLRPPLLPLRLLPLVLLLLGGAASQAEPGFETESPVRTLQVETLVRRLPLSAPRGRSGARIQVPVNVRAGRRSAGTELRVSGLGQEWDLWRILRDSCSPVIGGAPRAVRGARCLGRHAAHTLHGEGCGGAGGAWEGAAPRCNTSALAWTRGEWLGE